MKKRLAMLSASRLAVMAVVTAAILVIAGVWLTLSNVEAQRRQQVAELGVQTRIAAESLSAALAFDDHGTMREFVEALAQNPRIRAAAVYDSAGRQVVAYQRAQEHVLPDVLTPLIAQNARTDDVIVVEPITANGENLGAIYVMSGVEPLSDRLARYSPIILLMVLAALVVGAIGMGQAMLTRANRELERRAASLTAEMARREAAERALMQSQRMEAIGQLTGGLAHDFNNLLAAIGGGLQLMLRTDNPDRRQGIADGMRQAIDRGARLTRQLLTFARGSNLERQVVAPAELIQSIQDLLRGSLREDIVLDYEMTPDVWDVAIDPDQFELALLNLAVNARDAMPRGGHLVIRIGNVVRDEAPLGEFVRLSVRDTGEGMPDNVADRAFEPFFTTKEVGKGSGLGLAQVYGFARQSGGRAWIESGAGKGTAIFIDLPRANGAPRPAPLPGPPAPAPAEPRPARTPDGAPISVLLVEDDDNVASVVKDLMRESGFSVKRAASAADALDLLARQNVDLVFSDIVMPGGMNGVELGREIRRRYPGVPVLLTTGFSGKADIEPGEFRIFRKPFEPSVMVAEIAQAVASERAADAH